MTEKDVPKYAVTGKRRMNATERNAYIQLACAYTICRNIEPDLCGREALAPGTMRRLRTVITHLRKIYNTLIRTVEVDQQLQLDRAVDATSYTVGAKPAMIGSLTEDRQYGWVVDVEAMEIIGEGLRDHCMMCTREGSEEKTCPLRRALDRIGTDVKHDGMLCGYKTEDISFRGKV